MVVVVVQLPTWRGAAAAQWRAVHSAGPTLRPPTPERPNRVDEHPAGARHGCQRVGLGHICDDDGGGRADVQLRRQRLQLAPIAAGQYERAAREQRQGETGWFACKFVIDPHMQQVPLPCWPHPLNVLASSCAIRLPVKPVAPNSTIWALSSLAMAIAGGCLQGRSNTDRQTSCASSSNRFLPPIG